MKNNKFKVLLLIVLAMVLGLSMLACDDKTPVPQQYTVAVTGGTGGGTFDKDASCTVTATIPAGKIFAKWTVAGTQVSVVNPYTFTVTKDVTVVAEFADVVIAEYSVTVDGAVFSSTAKAGDIITLTVPTQEGKTFTGWNVVSGGITVADNNIFTMPAGNVEVTSVFEDITYDITVTDGTIDGETEITVNYNTEKTAIADNKEGYQFVRWTVGGVQVSTDVSYTFTPTSNTDLVAYFVKLELKLETPDNSNSKLFYKEEGNAIAIDREVKKMFASDTIAYTKEVKMFIYTSVDATTSVGSFKIVLDPASTSDQAAGWVMSNDGTIKISMKGGMDNGFYFDLGEYDKFVPLLKKECGLKYGEGKTFYFAAQLIANAEVVVDGVTVAVASSEISEIGAIGFCPDSTKPAEDYNITTIIGGNTTTITAGYGATHTFVATAQEGKLFKGWTVKNGTEYGEIVSVSLNYTTKIVATITLEAVFVDATVEKITITTPDNSADQMIKIAAAPIEFDRQESGTAFVTGVDYIKYYVYTSNAVGADVIDMFKLHIDADGAGWISKMDGTFAFKLDGTKGTFTGRQGDSHNALKLIIPAYHDNDDLSYYFAAQAVAVDGTIYADSAIGAKGLGITGI